MTNRQNYSKDKSAEAALSAAVVKRITSILKSNHMSQRELAHRLGKSEAVISRWLGGVPNMTLRSICQIADALGEQIISVNNGKPSNPTSLTESR